MCVNTTKMCVAAVLSINDLHSRFGSMAFESIATEFISVMLQTWNNVEDPTDTPQSSGLRTQASKAHSRKQHVCNQETPRKQQELLNIYI